MATDRAAPYRTADLDIPRLQRYARRVAGEAGPPTHSPMLKTEQQNVIVQRTRQVGFLGLRRETYDVTESRPINVEVVPPHWQLFHTNRWVEESNHHVASEYNEQHYWMLTGAGDLLYVWTWEEHRRAAQSIRGDLTHDISVSSMSSDNILELNHDHLTFNRHHGQTHEWGNGVVGKRTRHAPGVGLSLALKNLLNTP
jgi:hypothetical protein